MFRAQPLGEVKYHALPYYYHVGRRAANIHRPRFVDVTEALPPRRKYRMPAGSLIVVALKFRARWCSTRYAFSRQRLRRKSIGEAAERDG